MTLKYLHLTAVFPVENNSLNWDTASGNLLETAESDW